MTDPSVPSPATHAVAAILVAAGRGARFGAPHNKVFEVVLGRPLWWHAASRFHAHPAVWTITIVFAEGDRDYWNRPEIRSLVDAMEIRLVPGGDVRTASVAAGVAALNDNDPPWVALHDAARPCVTTADLTEVFSQAFANRAAILARPLHGAIKRGSALGPIGEHVDRRGLWEALTPQVFHRDVLQAALGRWRGRPIVDDALLVDLAGFPVTLVPGQATNIKVTTPEDLVLATAILEQQSR